MSKTPLDLVCLGVAAWSAIFPVHTLVIDHVKKTTDLNDMVKRTTHFNDTANRATNFNFKANRITKFNFSDTWNATDHTGSPDYAGGLDTLTIVKYVSYGLGVVPVLMSGIGFIGYLCLKKLRGDDLANTSNGIPLPGNAINSGLAATVATSGVTPVATVGTSGLAPPDSSSPQFGSMTYATTNFMSSYASYSEPSSYSNFAKT